MHTKEEYARALDRVKRARDEALNQIYPNLTSIGRRLKYKADLEIVIEAAEQFIKEKE